MLDVFLGILAFFARAIAFVLDVWVSVSRLRQFARSRLPVVWTPIRESKFRLIRRACRRQPSVLAEAEARRDHQSKAIVAIGGDDKRSADGVMRTQSRTGCSH